MKQSITLSTCTPVQYAQAKIVNELHKNAEIAKKFQDNMRTGIQGLLFRLSDGDYFEESVAFLIGMVNKGEWDYKYKKEWQVPYANFDGKDMNLYNQKNYTGWMYFDGMLIAADKFGNMNMAYVGRKMGLPYWVYQNFTTEDKDDAYWVQYGIDMAEQER